MGASIGISIYPSTELRPTLINKADLAMYQVKNNGAAAILYSEEFDELNVISN